MFTSPGSYWLAEQGGNGASLSLGECDSPEELNAALDQVKAQGGAWDNWVVHGPPAVPAISTGNQQLDAALGIGGIPQGRLTALTTIRGDCGQRLARAIVVQAQRVGAVVCWVDCTGDLDLRELREAGIDCARLLASQPADAASARDIAHALVRSGQIGLVVVDQPPDMSSAAMRTLLRLAQDTGTAVLFLTERGGTAAFHTSVRMRCEHASVLVVKNKYAPPYQRVHLNGSGATIPATSTNHEDARPQDVEITNH